MIKEKANLSEGIGKPQGIVQHDWKMLPKMEFFLLRKNLALLPLHNHPIFHRLQVGWLDCLFYFFFSPCYPCFINTLREPNCSSNGLLCGTLLAPSSDVAYGAVVIQPRPVLASQISWLFDRLSLCVTWYQKLSDKVQAKYAHGFLESTYFDT